MDPIPGPDLVPSQALAFLPPAWHHPDPKSPYHGHPTDWGTLLSLSSGQSPRGASLTPPGPGPPATGLAHALHPQSPRCTPNGPRASTQVSLLLPSPPWLPPPGVSPGSSALPPLGGLDQSSGLPICWSSPLPLPLPPRGWASLSPGPQPQRDAPGTAVSRPGSCLFCKQVSEG